LCAIGFPIVDCQSTRLNEAARHVFIENNNLAQLTTLPIGNAKTFFEKRHWLGKRGEIALKILKEVVERLPFLVNVGLDYLTLRYLIRRQSPTHQTLTKSVKTRHRQNLIST